ncbi:hypothetical protein [Vibrio phage YC]|uniref:Uncharacterized protein n=1 Tax=Vibrio phage YC TaxID=2267403 RepID=A0A384ZS81_9CAUD|nr:hypothetical protein HWB64_gp116 [Vibrio phage YC]AXC34485.1 hypothetical protein [Vibrio phage YC]
MNKVVLETVSKDKFEANIRDALFNADHLSVNEKADIVVQLGTLLTKHTSSFGQQFVSAKSLYKHVKEKIVHPMVADCVYRTLDFAEIELKKMSSGSITASEEQLLITSILSAQLGEASCVVINVGNDARLGSKVMKMISKTVKDESQLHNIAIIGGSSASNMVGHMCSCFKDPSSVMVISLTDLNKLDEANFLPMAEHGFKMYWPKMPRVHNGVNITSWLPKGAYL